MDASSGSKRARSESGSAPSRSGTPPAPATPPRDAELEAQMDLLGVDDDFKASLRSMSPNTRRDVINDIVRSQRAEQVQRVLSLRSMPGFGISRFVPMERRPQASSNSNDEEEEYENEANGGVEDVNSFFVDISPDMGGRGEPVSNISERILRRMLQQVITPQNHAILGGEPFGFFNQIGEILAQRSMGLTQDVDDMSYEQLLELQERIGFVSKGITAEQKMHCINEVERPKEGKCAVCQGEWQESPEGERCVEIKTCKHVFHRNCIDEWLNSNKNCPLCMRDVL